MLVCVCVSLTALKTMVIPCILELWAHFYPTWKLLCVCWHTLHFSFSHGFKNTHVQLEHNFCVTTAEPRTSVRLHLSNTATQHAKTYLGASRSNPLHTHPNTLKQSVSWVGTSMGGLIGMMLSACENTPIRCLVMVRRSATDCKHRKTPTMHSLSYNTPQTHTNKQTTKQTNNQTNKQSNQTHSHWVHNKTEWCRTTYSWDSSRTTRNLCWERRVRLVCRFRCFVCVVCVSFLLCVCCVCSVCVCVVSVRCACVLLLFGVVLVFSRRVFVWFVCWF